MLIFFVDREFEVFVFKRADNFSEVNFVFFLKILEYLYMRWDLFPGALFSSFEPYVTGNKFVST